MIWERSREQRVHELAEPSNKGERRARHGLQLRVDQREKIVRTRPHLGTRAAALEEEDDGGADGPGGHAGDAHAA
jgi:hypothetical protein